MFLRAPARIPGVRTGAERPRAGAAAQRGAGVLAEFRLSDHAARE
ncbi:hypothetical protein [Streptomyces sp. NPDC054866]